jgi:hypothetical protein
MAGLTWFSPSRFARKVSHNYLNINNMFMPETKIILPVEIYHKMLAYAKISKGEISGFGKTSIQKKSKDLILVHVTKVQIFKQVVSGAHTGLQKDDLHKWYFQLAKANENPGHWNLWWHSHFDFSVGFSGIDDKTIIQLSDKKTGENKLYSICINQAGDLVGRVDNKDIVDEECKVVVNQPISKLIMQQCEDDVKQLVTYDTGIFHNDLTKTKNNVHQTTGHNTTKFII